MEAIDLVDAFMRNDITAARLDAQLLVINAESQGLVAIGRVAREILERLSPASNSDQHELGEAIARLGDLLNPEAP